MKMKEKQATGEHEVLQSDQDMPTSLVPQTTGEAQVPTVQKNPIEKIRENVDLLDRLYHEFMKDGIHYGEVPGCKKPCLLQPGAEKIVEMFQLTVDPIVKKEWLPGGHLNVDVTIKLFSRQGVYLGGGIGSCSTLESKYRWRKEERVCPACGKTSIIKGKKEYGGGWLCWKKKDGCGTTFADGDKTIEDQQVGRVENPDIADQYNTVTKMSYKRGFVSAVKTISGVSERFTVDMEENQPEETNGENGKQKPKPSNVDADIKFALSKLPSMTPDVLQDLLVRNCNGKTEIAELTDLEKQGLLKYLKGMISNGAKK